MNFFLSRFNSVSFSKDYTVFGIVFFIALVVLVTFLSIVTYFSYLDSREERLFNASHIVHLHIEESISYVNQIMLFLADKVAQHGKADEAFLENLFYRQFSSVYDNRNEYIWSVFDFVTPDSKVLVSSSDGILKDSLSVNDRNYLKKTDQLPWLLHFSEPAIGITSGKKVIPAAIGVETKSGDYLGAITMGFDIKKLIKRTEDVLNDESLRFLIVNLQGKVLFHNIALDENHYLSTSLPQLTRTLETKKLQSSFNIHDIVFENYIFFNNTPFILFTGYDLNASDWEFKELLLPRILEALFICCLIAVMMFYMRKNFIIPVSKLVKAAKTNNQVGIKTVIPRSGINELDLLADRLEELEESLNKERKSKLVLEETRGKLEKALQIIKESDNAKEEFLIDMHSALRTPLKAVLNGLYFFKTSEDNYFKSSKNQAILETMHEAAFQLRTLSTDFLNISPINIKDVLKKCVVIQKRYASEKGVNLIIKQSSDRIPLIHADKLRMRQVILSCIQHSLLYLPDDADHSIHISIKVQKSTKANKPDAVRMIIEDDGVNLDEETRQLFWDQWFEEDAIYSRDPNMMHLDLKAVRHLIALHHGKFSIDVDKKKSGSKFIITIPFAAKGSFPCQENTNNSKRNGVDKVKEKNSKIIAFPLEKKE